MQNNIWKLGCRPDLGLRPLFFSYQKILVHGSEYIDQYPLPCARHSMHHMGLDIVPIPGFDPFGFVSDGHIKDAAFHIRHMIMGVAVLVTECARLKFDFDHHDLIIMTIHFPLDSRIGILLWQIIFKLKWRTFHRDKIKVWNLIFLEFPH